MIKRIIGIVCIAVLVATLSVTVLAGCSFFKGIDFDEVKKNLEDAGYEVTVMTASQYVEWENAIPALTEVDLKKYLYAVKGDDVLHLFVFYSTDDASDNSGFIHFNSLKQGQSNESIYAATKQAKEDAKI